MLGFEADFGSGFHALGGPTGRFTLTWELVPIVGTDAKAVRVRTQGTLYLDRALPGRARVRVLYETASGTTILEDVESLCGPGGNANSPANQKAVNFSFTHQALRRVVVVVGAGGAFFNPFTGVCSPFGAMEDEHAGVYLPPTLRAHDVFNSGPADFGRLPHVAGTPVGGATVQLRLNADGRIEGHVSGTLFWDSFAGGTARLIVDFRDASGNVLLQRVIDETGPTGGNALQASNQTAVNQNFTSGALFQIRVRVGTPSGAGVANAISRTYSLGPAVGVAEGVPTRLTTRVGEETSYGIRWTVTDAENWRALDTLDVRLVDEHGEALLFVWDQTTNTFRQPHTKTPLTFNVREPGSRGSFETPELRVLFRNTDVVGSGPNGMSVLLDLALRFKPQAAGRTFRVEVRATDDSGVVQAPATAGTITVLPRGAN